MCSHRFLTNTPFKSFPLVNVLKKLLERFVAVLYAKQTISYKLKVESAHRIHEYLKNRDFGNKVNNGLYCWKFHLRAAISLGVTVIEAVY